MIFSKIGKYSITLLLAIVVLVLPLSSAFADGNPTATSVPVRELDKSNVDTNYANKGSIGILGTSKPTTYWNLVNNYNGSATFAYRIYTNYYFSPSANNDIYVTFTANWLSSISSSVRIDCYEVNGGVVTSFTTNGVPPISNTVRFYNLDPNKFYFFEFIKTDDQVDADLSFTVSR